MGYRYDVEELENEKKYLLASKDSDIVKQIIKEQSRFLGDAYCREDYFLESMDGYNKIINLIAKLVKELKIEKNSIVLSIILRKLILDGYFSVDNKFNATTEGSFYDINLLEGLDIINGNGCCRHLAKFNQDLFKVLNIYNRIITCYYGTLGESLDSVFSMCSNHAANLIKYDDTIYGYNCYENYIFKSENGFVFNRIVDLSSEKKKEYRLFYKPSATVMISETSYDEAISFIKILNSNSRNKMISYDDFLQFQRDAKKVLFDNKELFDDLKEDSKKYTKKISTSLRNEYNELIDDLYYS